MHNVWIDRKIIRAQHSTEGHSGGPRLWVSLQRWFIFANEGDAKRLSLHIQKQCEVCQASQASHIPFKCPIEMCPVSPYLMDSVSLDMFAMPEVTFEGQKYDYMCVCVDRESGWMIATPYLEKGFTAEKIG